MGQNAAFFSLFQFALYLCRVKASTQKVRGASLSTKCKLILHSSRRLVSVISAVPGPEQQNSIRTICKAFEGILMNIMFSMAQTSNGLHQISTLMYKIPISCFRAVQHNFSSYILSWAQMNKCFETMMWQFYDAALVKVCACTNMNSLTHSLTALMQYIMHSIHTRPSTDLLSLGQESII